MTQIGPGTLKLVLASSERRSLRAAIEAVLLAQAAATNVRHLTSDIFLVHTEAPTDSVRDWLVPLIEEGESLFVVEFERWSGYGPAVDREWLRERGH